MVANAGKSTLINALMVILLITSAKRQTAPAISLHINHRCMPKLFSSTPRSAWPKNKLGEFMLQETGSVANSDIVLYILDANPDDELP